MSLKPYQQKMMGLMIDQELKIAEIYQLFSKRYPEVKEFWLKAHREELEHAQWLEHLAKKANEGVVLFHEDKTRTYTVQAFVDYLEGILKKVRNGRQPLFEALSLATGLEESLLERKIFDHCKTDHPELTATLTRLRKESGHHAERIREMRDKNRTV